MTNLNITQQSLENRQVLLTVEVPDTRLEEAMRKTVRKLGKDIRIPGFRPGKAPYHIVVQRLGRERLVADVAEEMIDGIYEEALQSTGLQPSGPGNLTEITLEPLVYRFEVPLPPEVDPGDYRALRLPYEEPSDEVIASQAQAEIESMRAGQASLTEVERPIQYGDLVTISLKVTVDGEVALENDDWDVMPDEEHYTLAPEFDAAFIGMTAGESKSFDATFPVDGDSQWAGQQGHFEFDVIAVKGETLPELGDAFAALVGDHENYEDLYQEVYGHIAGHVYEDAKQAYEKEVMARLQEQATLRYPPAEIERMVDRIATEQESIFKSYGFESREEFLRLQGQTEEHYRADLRDEAEKRLRRELLLDAIVQKERIPVSDYERSDYLTNAVGDDEDTLPRLLDLLKTSESYRDYITAFLARRKAHELLIALARSEDVPGLGEHVAAEAPIPEPTEQMEADAPTEPGRRR